MSELETLLANMAVGDVTHIPGLTVRCVPGGWIYTVMPEIGTAVGSSSAFVPRPDNYSRTNKYKPDEPRIKKGDFVEVTRPAPDGETRVVDGIMQTDVNLCDGMAEVYTLGGVITAHHTTIKGLNK